MVVKTRTWLISKLGISMSLNNRSTTVFSKLLNRIPESTSEWQKRWW